MTSSAPSSPGETTSFSASPSPSCLPCPVPTQSSGLSPLRSLSGSTKWATLIPLSISNRSLLPRKTSSHKPLTFTPGHGGRHRKATIVSNENIDYSKTGPFKLGKGPKKLGYYPRKEHLRPHHGRPVCAKSKPSRCVDALQGSSGGRVGTFHRQRKSVKCEKGEGHTPTLSSTKPAKPEIPLTYAVAHPTIFKQEEIPRHAYRTWGEVLSRYTKVARRHGLFKHRGSSEHGHLHSPALTPTFTPKFTREVEKDMSKLATDANICVCVSDEMEIARREITAFEHHESKPLRSCIHGSKNVADLTSKTPQPHSCSQVQLSEIYMAMTVMISGIHAGIETPMQQGLSVDCPSFGASSRHEVA